MLEAIITLKNGKRRRHQYDEALVSSIKWGVESALHFYEGETVPEEYWDWTMDIKEIRIIYPERE